MTSSDDEAEERIPLGISVQFEWQIEHLDTIDNRGRKMAKVTEIYRGIDADSVVRFVPSALAENFVNARRDFVNRIMASKGHIKLIVPHYLN